MTHLVDTDVFIDLLADKPHAAAIVESLAPDGLAISLVTYGEALDGVLHGHNPADAEARFDLALRRFSLVTLTEPIMRRFAQLRGDRRKAGRPRGDADLIIACTAIELNLTLVTRNLRHYEDIPELRLFPMTAVSQGPDF